MSTRVVSWNEAAEMKESVESEAFVIPRSIGRAVGRLAAGGHHPLVLLLEPEAVDLLVDQELGVADLFDLHAAHHLADDDLDVLVVDGDVLRAVDLLDLVHQVPLQLLLAQDRQDVVRVDRAVDQRIARAHPLASPAR